MAMQMNGGSSGQAVSLKFNTEQLATLNGSLRSRKTDLETQFSKLSQTLSGLSSLGTIGTLSINSEIAEVEQAMKTINAGVNTNLEDLINFMGKQMGGYENLTREATKLLQQALEFINTTFGANTN